MILVTGAADNSSYEYEGVDHRWSAGLDKSAAFA